MTRICVPGIAHLGAYLNGPFTVRPSMTSGHSVVVGASVLGFFGVVAAIVIVVLVRKGVAWNEVPGSRNRLTGLAINWFWLVVLAYSGLLSLVVAMLLR